MLHSFPLICMSVCANIMLSLLEWQIIIGYYDASNIIFFLLRIVLAIWGLLCFNMNFRIASYNSVMNVIEAFREIALSF